MERCLRLYSGVTPTGRGSYRIVRAMARGYPPAFRSGEFRIPGGTRMMLDLGCYPDCTMAFGLYELETARALRAFLRAGDTFVDAGANIGYFSLMAAKCVGPEGTVHSFEPFPENRSRLIDHAQMNGVQGIVQVHPQALSNFDGEMSLHRYADPAANHGQVTAFPQSGQQTKPVTAHAVSLDKHLPGVFPRLIKMDVEGSELAALQGMRRILEAAKPAVIIEFNPVTSRQAGIREMDIVELLMSAVPQYRCRALRWPARQFVPTAAQLSRLGEVNLLFDVPQPTLHRRSPP